MGRCHEQADSNIAALRQKLQDATPDNVQDEPVKAHQRLAAEEASYAELGVHIDVLSAA